MSQGSSSRPRRANANYASLVNKQNIVESNRLNPTENIRKKVKKTNNVTEVTILSKEKENNKNNETTHSQQTDEITMENNENTEQILDEIIEISNYTAPTIINNDTTNTDDTYGWQTVSKNRKGKNKLQETPGTENITTTDKDEIESVTSFTSENSNNPSWRSYYDAKKYKIWTHASKILGKNVGEKIEHVKTELRKVTEYTKIVSEIHNKERMISAYFNNQENVTLAQKVDIGIDAKKLTYMHRALVFKRNPEKEFTRSIKLWDIPLGIRYKELEIELTNLFGPIERMNLRVNNM